MQLNIQRNYYFAGDGGAICKKTLAMASLTELCVRANRYKKAVPY